MKLDLDTLQLSIVLLLPIVMVACGKGRPSGNHSGKAGSDQLQLADTLEKSLFDFVIEPV